MPKRRWMIPREHGAWMMFYAPLVVGMAHGKKARLDLLALVLAATAGYCFRVPLGVLLSQRKGEYPAAWRWLVGYGLIGLVSATMLLGSPNLRRLAAVGFVGAILLGVHFGLSLRREHRSVFGEMLGIAGLVLTAPLGYFAALGNDWRWAGTLWAVNFLFFGSSVFYVKWRVQQMVAQKRGTRTAPELFSLIAYHVVAACILGGITFAGMASWTVFLAFLPLGLRYFLPLLIRSTLTLTHIGVSEIILSLAFVALAIWVI